MVNEGFNQDEAERRWAADSESIERLRRCVKRGATYLRDSDAGRGLIIGLAGRFTFYIGKRLHQGLPA